MMQWNSRKTTPKATLGLIVTLALGGCTSSPTTPAITATSLTPNQTLPGATIQVGYTIAGASAWKDVDGIQVIGLPANATPSGMPKLPLPTGGDQPQSAALAIPIPAARGDFPLQLRFTFKDGKIASQPIGPLKILDAPAKLDGLTIEPASHSVGACQGRLVKATLRYGITDENGAADLGRVRLVPIDGPSAGPIGALGFNVIPEVEASDPNEDPIYAGAILNISKRADLVHDVVSTVIEIPCQIPAPATWSLKLVGIDDVMPTNTISVEYTTTP